MERYAGENLWYVLDAVNGIGYAFLFVLLIFWVRLLLIVIEDVVKPGGNRAHKLTGPIEDPAENEANLGGPGTAEQSDSIATTRALST